jgi:hypothetical protein
MTKKRLVGAEPQQTKGTGFTSLHTEFTECHQYLLNNYQNFRGRKEKRKARVTCISCLPLSFSAFMVGPNELFTILKPV